MCGSDGDCNVSDMMSRGLLDKPDKVYSIIQQVVRICEQSHSADMALVNIGADSVYLHDIVSIISVETVKSARCDFMY